MQSPLLRIHPPTGITQQQQSTTRQQTHNVRIIPRRNGSNDAEGHVFDAGRLVEEHRTRLPVLGLQPQFARRCDRANLFRRGEHLPQAGIHRRLARIARRDAADLRHVLAQVRLQRAQHGAALRKSRPPPLVLGAGRLDARVVHIGRRHGRDLSEPLLGGGIKALDHSGPRGIAQARRRGPRRWRRGRDAVVLPHGKWQIVQHDFRNGNGSRFPQQFQIVAHIPRLPKSAHKPNHRQR